MAAIGGGLILVGVLTLLVGIGGYVDTRKVDRRYRTGYKNNEPDARDFGRATKRVLYGIGICIVGAAANSLAESKSDSSLPVSAQSAAAPVQSTDSTVASPESTILPTDTVTSTPTNQTSRKDTASSAGQPRIKDTVLSADQSHAKNAAAPMVEASPGSGERVYSDNEIAQMEDEKQYHGDDPIVRSRLGLPSRETGKLTP